MEVGQEDGCDLVGYVALYLVIWGSILATYGAENKNIFIVIQPH